MRTNKVRMIKNFGETHHLGMINVFCKVDFTARP